MLIDTSAPPDRPADDVDVVWRIDGDGLPVQGAPLRNASRHPGRDLGELTDHGAQGVYGMSASDGQRVGAVGAYTLPDAAGATLQLGLGDGAQVCRQHLTDVAPLDEVTRVQNGRVAARLETDGRLQGALTGEPRHLLRLGQICAERPLAEHGLAGLQAGHDQLPVTRHAHADDDEIDVRMRRHVAEPVERQPGTKRSGRGPGSVLMRGADRLELVARQRLQGRNVGVGPPAASSLGHGRSDDSYADLVRHLNLQVWRASRSCPIRGHLRCPSNPGDPLPDLGR